MRGGGKNLDHVPPSHSSKSDAVGEFLGIGSSTVVRFAKAGLIPGHPLRVSGHRTHWRFLLSEVREAMLTRKSKVLTERNGERKELRGSRPVLERHRRYRRRA